MSAIKIGLLKSANSQFRQFEPFKSTYKWLLRIGKPAIYGKKLWVYLRVKTCLCLADIVGGKVQLVCLWVVETLRN